MRDKPKARRSLMNDCAEDFARAFKQGLREFVELQSVHETCLTCNWFSEQGEICAKFSARPPARVIAYGCDNYENDADEIPF